MFNMATSTSQQRPERHNYRVRFAGRLFYSRPLHAEEYQRFSSFVDHVKGCPSCVKGIDTRSSRLCRLGLHLGKLALVLVHYNSGELYSAFDWDVNNDSVRLEVDHKLGDVKRIAKLLQLEVICRAHPYGPARAGHSPS